LGTQLLWERETKQMKIFIPFKEHFEEAMLSGRKTWTTRSKKHGKSGDIFEIFGAKFQIIDVEQMRLGQILDHYKQEGCKSPEEFIRIWNTIHPKKGFNPFDVYWVHFFKLLGVEG
jgi:hypothetical protein